MTHPATNLEDLLEPPLPGLDLVDPNVGGRLKVVGRDDVKLKNLDALLVLFDPSFNVVSRRLEQGGDEFLELCFFRNLWERYRGHLSSLVSQVKSGMHYGMGVCWPARALARNIDALLVGLLMMPMPRSSARVHSYTTMPSDVDSVADSKRSARGFSRPVDWAFTFIPQTGISASLINNIDNFVPQTAARVCRMVSYPLP